MAGQPPKRILPNPLQPPPREAPPVAGSSTGPRQVLRVNRACNSCRKQKMRCEGPENPPCLRCRNNGVQCVFEKVTKDNDGAQQRLNALETQFSTMQGTLSEILSHLKPNPQSAPPPPPPSHHSYQGQAPVGYYHPENHVNGHTTRLSPLLRMERERERPATSALPPTLQNHYEGPHNPALSHPELVHGTGSESLPSFNSFLSTHTHPHQTAQPSYSPAYHSRDAHHPHSGSPSYAAPTSALRTSSSSDYAPLPNRPPSNSSLPHQQGYPSAAEPRHRSTGGSNQHAMLPPLSALATPHLQHQQSNSPEQIRPNANFDRLNIHHLADSAVTSAANSDDEGDIPTHALVRPIHVLDAMASETSSHERDRDRDRRDRRLSTSTTTGSDHLPHRQSSMASPSTHSSNTSKRKRRSGSAVQPNRDQEGEDCETSDDIRGPTKHRPKHRRLSSSHRSTETLSQSSPSYERDTQRDHEGTDPYSTGKGSGVEGLPDSTAKSESEDVDADTQDEGERRRRVREKDVVELGMISDEDARELYDIYFTGCYRLLACFSPVHDTYDSMRARSPFCFCSILLVAAKVRGDKDADGLRQHDVLERECIRMARSTIYSEYRGLWGPDEDHEGNITLESVQAMLLLAGWSHSDSTAGWLVAGHAIRCAVELGWHKALPKLGKKSAARAAKVQASSPTVAPTLEGIHAGRPAEADDHTGIDAEEILLVRSARTWCALFVFEYQISFGTGRPAMMKADRSITNARGILLGHPLATATDSRLVSTCELLTLQGQVNDRLGPLDQLVDARTFETLREATRIFDGWFTEWDTFMGRDHTTDGFYRASAAIQRSYANLFTRSIALRQLKTKADALNISPEMKEIVLSAIGSARECVDICVNNVEYRDGMRYAVAYTHTCAAFAGAFLLRFARLFPYDMDALETIDMVDKLATLLSDVRAGRFGRSLNSMLDHTRARIKSANTFSVAASELQLHQRLANIDTAVSGSASNSQKPHITNSASPPSVSGPPQHSFSIPPNPAEAPHSQAQSLAPGFTNGFPSQALLNEGIPQNALDMGLDMNLSGTYSDVPLGELQSLLGDGDWPPWIQNSMFGDLEIPGASPLGDMTQSFSWDL